MYQPYDVLFTYYARVLGFGTRRFYLVDVVGFSGLWAFRKCTISYRRFPILGAKTKSRRAETSEETPETREIGRPIRFVRVRVARGDNPSVATFGVRPGNLLPMCMCVCTTQTLPLTGTGLTNHPRRDYRSRRQILDPCTTSTSIYR